jgi:DNA-binding response OmpR family regulator
MHQLALVKNPIGAERVNDERPDPKAAAREVPAPRKGTLLFVDSDDFLIEMIESGLSLTRPKWQVIATRHPADALDVLKAHSELDAIITEIVFGDSSRAGKAFIREVSRRWPEIPIFVMTHLNAEETHGLDTAEYIAKPPDIDFLVSRVDRAIRRQRESLVRGISLPTFLQIMEMEKKTCTVVVSHGGRVGELYFRNGKLIQARLDETEGEAALFGMLSMPEHSLRVIDKCDAERGISTSLTSLLFEWSVREDHAKQDQAKRSAAASHEEDE